MAQEAAGRAAREGAALLKLGRAAKEEAEILKLVEARPRRSAPPAPRARAQPIAAHLPPAARAAAPQLRLLQRQPAHLPQRLPRWRRQWWRQC